MQKQNEQNIFMFWSINYLKSLYFDTLNYLTNRNRYDSDIKNLLKTSNVFKIKTPFIIPFKQKEMKWKFLEISV